MCVKSARLPAVQMRQKSRPVVAETRERFPSAAWCLATDDAGCHIHDAKPYPRGGQRSRSDGSTPRRLRSRNRARQHNGTSGHRRVTAVWFRPRASPSQRPAAATGLGLETVECDHVVLCESRSSCTAPPSEVLTSVRNTAMRNSRSSLASGWWPGLCMQILKAQHAARGQLEVRNAPVFLRSSHTDFPRP